MESPIWFNKSLQISDIIHFGKKTMGEHLGMEFLEIGPDYLVMRMPVDDRTRQPYGVLHGGASVALAETAGSVGSALIVDHQKFRCVGLEINANHLRSVSNGFVFAKAMPVHIGRTTHVWDIRITNHHNKLVCISRLTVAIILRSSTEIEATP